MIKFSFKQVYVLDCGKNTSTLYNPVTDEVTQILHKEVLSLHETLPEGSVLVCEYSHLGYPRREKSLSQPFTAEELLRLYKDLKDNGIRLMLFPQKSTPRAIGFVNELYKAGKIELPSFVVIKNGRIIKCDINDPWVISVFLQHHPQTSMANPPKRFASEENPDLYREAIYEYKDHTNYLCNVARTFSYTDNISDWIRFNIQYIYENLSEEARDIFNIEFYSDRGAKKRRGKINCRTLKMPQLFSIAATLINEDGTNRVRSDTGQSLGWGYVKRHILCMTPFHMKGGTARSNLYYHGLKSWVSTKIDEILGTTDTKKRARGGMLNNDTDKDGKKPFTDQQESYYVYYRKVYCDAIREVWQLFKRMRTSDSTYMSTFSELLENRDKIQQEFTFENTEIS